jgi:two-component system NarL family sensor kinase
LIVVSDTNLSALQRHNHELSILNAIAQALNREVDLDVALRVTLAHVLDLCQLQTGWIWLLDEAHGQPYLAATQQLPPALAHSPQRMNGQTYCYCLDSYQKGDMRGAANINIITCTRLQGLVDGTDGLRYHASIPLYEQGRKLGVLNVVSRDWRELSADDLRLLATVGDLLSIAIGRARLFRRSAQAGATEERARLARDLHDTLAQGLTAIALQLETADALFERQPETARQMVQQALAQVQANLADTRRSLHNLRLPALDATALPEALGRLLRDYGMRWNLHVEQAMQPDLALPAPVEEALFRIAQEVLANIVRHAGASRISLSLHSDGAAVTMQLSDDGRGFDSANVPPDRYGLLGINERVHRLHGTWQLESAPGAGTNLAVTLPLELSV